MPGGGWTPGLVPASRPAGVIGPAVGMIIAGAANFLLSGVYLLAGLSNIGGGDFDKSVNPGDTGGAIGYVIGSVFPILCLVLSPATVIGGIQMLRGRSRGLVLFGAVTAVVPLSSCCFVLGIPAGIWALVVLRRPQVRAWFVGGPPAPPQAQYQYPPGPYQPWR